MCPLSTVSRSLSLIGECVAVRTHERVQPLSSDGVPALEGLPAGQLLRELREFTRAVCSCSLPFLYSVKWNLVVRSPLLALYVMDLIL
jgi:hypothetical protein